jgi:metallophosphoesterase (TIGR00282 family)
MRALMIGDVFAKPGRDAIVRLVRRLVTEHKLDLVIANGENAAGGLGITAEIADEMLGAEVDVITSGNHVWKHKDYIERLLHEPRCLRPANYPEHNPGRGHGLYHLPDGRPYGVVNLIGRIFMDPSDDPFAVGQRLVEELRKKTKVIFVDMHGEATSEKRAMGWFLDGKVSAVVGTHTHVQTADAEVLPGGTAYLTDLGFTGCPESIIGVKTEAALARFVNARPAPFDTAKGKGLLQGAIIDVDDTTGRARSIERVQVRMPD